jgi:hypothetical protein
MLAIGTTLDVRARGGVLRAYMGKGGSLAVFCVDQESPYACCSLSDERGCGHVVSTMSRFPSMVARLARPLSDFALGNIVAAIHCHVQIPEFRDLAGVHAVADAAWAHLRATGFRTIASARDRYGPAA